MADLHPTLVAVDEAHCVSAWGYDFRPEYLHLGQALRDFGRPPVVALTATASSPVRADIIRFLGLDDPLVLVSGLDRPNIHLNAVLCADEPTRTRRLREFVVGAHGSPGIVYCPTRRSAQERADLLRAAGVDAHAYHAGLGAKQRAQLQDAFHNDSIAVMVATTAFGMGIDKPDVRWICHAALTDSPDSYYQEIGRAGRDGRPATALLLHREQDTGLRRYFAAVSVDPAEVAAVAEAVARAPTTRQRLATDLGVTRHRLGQLLGLLEQVGAVTTVRRWLCAVAGGPEPATAAALAVEQIEAQHAIRLSRIQMMEHYAETSHCRGRYLVAYFGDELPGPCGHCDNCDRGAGTQDAVAGPFPIHSTVQHRQWGRGTVLGYEQDRMTVLFDRVGYRTLALADVAHVLVSDR